MWCPVRVRKRAGPRAQATTVVTPLRAFKTSAIVLLCGSAIGLPPNYSFKRTPVHRLRFVQTLRRRRRLTQALGFAMKNLWQLLPALMLPLVSFSAYGAAARSIHAADLVANPKAYVGTLLSFSACLVDATPHGEFIKPCGHSDSQNILIVDAADFDDPFLALEKELKPKRWVHCARGKFTGVVVATTSSWPSKRQIMAIHLKSVSNLSQCKA